MPEEEKKEKKDDDKIILQVDMHCEGCKAKVRKALKEFKGVEGLDINLKDQKVTIKGKLDARKVYETVKKKSGKRTVLLYPDLKKEDEKKNEEPKKEEPPPDPESVVVLKVNMHCGACAKQIKRSLSKMDGVTDVKEDVANCTVTVKGRNIDANKVCDRVKKRSGKHCEIVPPPPPPKEEEKKDEKPAEEKKEEEKKDESKPADDAKKDEERPAEPEKKEGGEEKKDEKGEEKKEEKKEEEKKEEKKEEGDESKVEIKKYEYIPYRSVPEYVYPSHELFSDENPNACSIM